MGRSLRKVSSSADKPTASDNGYICRICRKPLGGFNEIDASIMEFFNMPEDGGAHAECLMSPSGSQANTKLSSKLANRDIRSAKK